MKKILLVSIVSLIALFAVGIFVLESSRNQPQQPIIPGIPTPTPVPNPILRFFGQPQVSPTPEPLKVTSSDPKDNETGVATNKVITITFNKPVTTDIVSFSIFPNASLSASFSQNQLILAPQEDFLSNFTYTLTINDAINNVITTIHFSTISIEQQQNPTAPTPTPIIPLTGAYPNIDQQGNAFDLQNHPDVFLANQTPYSQNTFSIMTKFINGTPVGHYQIIVTLIGEDKAKSKADFLNWVKNFGITDAQIQGLDILYQ